MAKSLQYKKEDDGEWSDLGIISHIGGSPRDEGQIDVSLEGHVFTAREMICQNETFLFKFEDYVFRGMICRCDLICEYLARVNTYIEIKITEEVLILKNQQIQSKKEQIPENDKRDYENVTRTKTGVNSPL